MAEPVLVLIHSSLVGATTWSRVAVELRHRGAEVVVPSLDDDDGRGRPIWRQYAESLALAVRRVGTDRALALVGHSGAGPRLPAMRSLLPHPVAAYLFVDSGLPGRGESQLALMAEEEPALAAQLRAHLASGGRFPEWTADDLREVVSDPNLRERVLREMRPRGLAYFEEPIPLPGDWPDAPCGYLHFSAVYDHAAERARSRGWPYRRIEGGHFHMLVHPESVADALLDLAGECARRGR